MSNKKGFTLIELVVVIAVLAILAAFAIPRFITLQSESRTASLNGLNGGVLSAVALAKTKYQAIGSMGATTVDMNGMSVACGSGSTSGGIPTGAAGGIGAAIQDLTGFTVDYTTATSVTFRPTNGGSATCQVSYNGTTGAATLTTTGC